MPQGSLLSICQFKKKKTLENSYLFFFKGKPR